MAEKKQYTFEDWKAGTIEQEYVDKNIEGFDDRNLLGVGFLPEDLNKQDFISEEEYSKIEKAQEETFYKAVEYAYKSLLNKFTARLNNAYKPVELIKNRIERLQSAIDDASNYTRDRVYAGEWSKIGIGHKAYAIANNPEKLGLAYLHNTLPTPFPNTKSVNHVFLATVNLRLKEELEHLLITKYSDSSDRKVEYTRQDIFGRAKQLKKDGMSVAKMFENIKKWLLNDLGFTEEEIKERYNFSLKDPDSFNRVVNKNTSHHK